MPHWDKWDCNTIKKSADLHGNCPDCDRSVLSFFRINWQIISCLVIVCTAFFKKKSSPLKEFEDLVATKLVSTDDMQTISKSAMLYTLNPWLNIWTEFVIGNTETRSVHQLPSLYTLLFLFIFTYRTGWQERLGHCLSLTLWTNCSTRVWSPHTSNFTVTSL